MKTNNAIQEFLSVRFRRLLSGAPDGIPPWLPVVAAGDRPGLYLPSDAPWVVHGDFSTLVGGIRALILQALHPATLAGVMQHSRYESDPLGRLSGTIRWLTITTFGSLDAVEAEASRVNRLHDRVNGTFADSAGEVISYSAKQERLLTWVHLAFTEAFLSAQQDFSIRGIPGGPDNYVSQWRNSAVPLGLQIDDLPATQLQLDGAMREFATSGELRFDESTSKVLDFIQRPPLPTLARPIYRLLYRAAIANLPAWAADLLGVRPRFAKSTIWLAKSVLRIMRAAIGPESPIEEAAILRLKRAGLIATGSQR